MNKPLAIKSTVNRDIAAGERLYVVGGIVRDADGSQVGVVIEDDCDTYEGMTAEEGQVRGE